MDRESLENQFWNNYLGVLVEEGIKDSHHTGSTHVQVLFGTIILMSLQFKRLYAILAEQDKRTGTLQLLRIYGQLHLENSFLA
jgi:hypothetical protein